jgi:hypothetical protein
MMMRLASTHEVFNQSLRWSERAPLANEYPTRFKTFDGKRHPRDVVEFDPAYPECMELRFAGQLTLGVGCVSFAAPPGKIGERA